MEGLTINSLLSTIFQLPILLFFYTYVLDLKWSKKEYLTILTIIFLPTCILSEIIGAPSILYFLAILAIMIYRKTKVIRHILHLFMALTFLVISDNLSYILAFHLFNEIGNELLTFISYFLFLIVFAIVFAFCYKRIVKYLIDRWVFNM